MKKQLTISKSDALARSSVLPPIQLTNTMPSVRTSLNRSPLRRGFFLIVLASLALACFALSPPAQAACQEGCNLVLGNTYLGDFTLGLDTTGSYNTAVGATVLAVNTTGSDNTAVGFFALHLNQTGHDNTATGFGALNSNTTGSTNTAFGSAALEFNGTGSANTATGQGALKQNTTGSNNTASGFEALALNTTGIKNTANGSLALTFNTTGSNNTANGWGALNANTTGSNNTATGLQALVFNTTGIDNTANGYQALFNNTTGSNNLANGFQALYTNKAGLHNTAAGAYALFHTTASNNAASGYGALYSDTTGAYNTAEGMQALYHNTSGSSNIALGYGAGLNLTTGTANIDIGNTGVAAETKTTRIGASQTRAFMAGVRGAVVSGGVGVFVSASGQLGTNPSSRRFKENIAAMDKKSEAILSLHPVTFRYKQDLDPGKTAQFGLIAEDVAKVNPDLVARDDKGQIYSVRYDAVNAMLLNEFLKEHATVEKMKATDGLQQQEITRQQQEISALKDQGTQQQKQIAALTTAIQKVNVQLATRKQPGQLAANDR